MTILFAEGAGIRSHRLKPTTSLYLATPSGLRRPDEQTLAALRGAKLPRSTTLLIAALSHETR